MLSLNHRLAGLIAILLLMTYQALSMPVTLETVHQARDSMAPTLDAYNKLRSWS